jgi:hypothetical protein
MKGGQSRAKRSEAAFERKSPAYAGLGQRRCGRFGRAFAVSKSLSVSVPPDEGWSFRPKWRLSFSSSRSSGRAATQRRNPSAGFVFVGRMPLRPFPFFPVPRPRSPAESGIWFGQDVAARGISRERQSPIGAVRQFPRRKPPAAAGGLLSARLPARGARAVRNDHFSAPGKLPRVSDLSFRPFDSHKGRPARYAR